jgi:hypothetical protein
MSYWFEEPHTLVLPHAPMDLRNPRKRDRLRAKWEIVPAVRALAPMAFAVITEICSG